MNSYKIYIFKYNVILDRVVEINNLNNILQTENTVCSVCYYKSKHLKKNKKNVTIE